MVLHSFWGLTPSVKSLCDDLADHGYTVLAPDINFGELPASEQEALDHLGKADPNRLASLVLSSAKLLHEKSTEGPIGIVGFGMGGSLALWASVRLADLVSCGGLLLRQPANRFRRVQGRLPGTPRRGRRVRVG